MTNADDRVVRDDLHDECEKWDPNLAKIVKTAIGATTGRYFRPEVRGVHKLPARGAALIVSNHSAGMWTPDFPIVAAAFYDMFGYDRPLYCLAHNAMFAGPMDRWMPRLGVVHANHHNVANALKAGAVVMVFPGGDYDVYRPTFSSTAIDFNGRTGYVTAAINAGVPVVPLVSIGGQETQFFLTRGGELARRLGLGRVRINILPLAIGFPFGLLPYGLLNLPLPAKIVTEVLEPVDIAAQFGDQPDIDEVDTHIRSVMQTALDKLGRERRYPIIG
ncbi:1-acyl-sn-glycerol-3-phosphate acyltransferase [Mycolicibacterium sp. 3033]|nr:1-acyl-sn-glycerol-3-phosphate acyltransferase [Mycolicibacterium aurantiacum]